MARKEHKVQLIKNGVRWIALEKDGLIKLSRDGTPAGEARWEHEQLLSSGAIIPDDVCAELEKLVKAQMDANWGED